MQRNYRGQRVDTKEWVYGYLVGENWIVGDIVDWSTEYVCLEFWCQVIPETVGQSTGIPDKNGKEIFESDILRDSLGWVFTVEWDSDNARFLGRHAKPRGDTYICYVGREPKAEIIGSIHDNPELLQEVDK